MLSSNGNSAVEPGSAMDHVMNIDDIQCKRKQH